MTDDARTPNAPGRPKDPAKREAILEAAKCLFIRLGYDKSSMAAIAAEAGVSKLTLYSHFTDKETLFVAAIKSRCEEQLPSLFLELNQHSPIREALLAIGRGFYALINSEEALELKRLMFTQLHNEPELVRLFHDAGPQRVLDAMENLLHNAHDTGVLNIPAPLVTAEHFLSLIMGAHHYRLLSGIEEAYDTDMAERHVQSVVELFLRAYAV